MHLTFVCSAAANAAGDKPDNAHLLLLVSFINNIAGYCNRYRVCENLGQCSMLGFDLAVACCTAANEVGGNRAGVKPFILAQV